MSYSFPLVILNLLSINFTTSPLANKMCSDLLIRINLFWDDETDINVSISFTDIFSNKSNLCLMVMDGHSIYAISKNQVRVVFKWINKYGWCFVKNVWRGLVVIIDSYKAFVVFGSSKYNLLASSNIVL